MKISYKALLYDISNMAFVIADTDDYSVHSHHRVRDIVQEGNIDRVSRVLGLSYAEILGVLSPIVKDPRIDIGKDISEEPRDYYINFREDGNLKYQLTKEKRLLIKETSHEYMVCRVLADWLGITLPAAADVWKFRGDTCMETLKEITTEMTEMSLCGFRRKISPF